MAQNVAGRHRSPERYNPLSELKLIAKDRMEAILRQARAAAHA